MGWVWGSVGQAGWAERLTGLCKRKLSFLGRTVGLSSTGREAAKRLGNAISLERLQSLWTRRAQELQPGAAGHGEAARFTVWRRRRCFFFLQSSPLACRAGRDSTGKEWGSFGLRKIFASVLGAA